MSNTRKTFILTDGTLQKLQALKEHLSYKHEVDVVVHAINELHESKLENYTAIAKARLNQPKPTIEEKAQREAELQMKTKEAKANRFLNEGKAFCEILEGEVSDNYCYWNSYELRNDGTVETTPERQAITYVGQSELDNQFMVSGDKVSKEVYNKKKKELANKSK